jgi:hypothetical protein
MQMVQAWHTASKLLGIEVVAPFTLRTEKKSADCIAFLPDFGRPQGMVIGMDTPLASAMENPLTECAKERGMFCSFLNPEMYATYNEEKFKEALIDWGFYGPSGNHPAWLKKTD